MKTKTPIRRLTISEAFTMRSLFLDMVGKHEWQGKSLQDYAEHLWTNVTGDFSDDSKRRGRGQASVKNTTFSRVVQDYLANGGKIVWYYKAENVEKQETPTLAEDVFALLKPEFQKLMKTVLSNESFIKVDQSFAELNLKVKSLTELCEIQSSVISDIDRKLTLLTEAQAKPQDKVLDTAKLYDVAKVSGTAKVYGADTVHAMADIKEIIPSANIADNLPKILIAGVKPQLCDELQKQYSSELDLYFEYQPKHNNKNYALVLSGENLDKGHFQKLKAAYKDKYTPLTGGKAKFIAVLDRFLDNLDLEV